MTLDATLAHVIDTRAATADDDSPIGVAFLDGEADAGIPCPTCDGQSEILVSGDPRSDNFITRICPDCKGEGEVSMAVADAIAGREPEEWDGP